MSESDFDAIIGAAGGSRIAEDGSADYVLNDAVVELKLIQEEGFEKETRQAKLAKLFRRTQPKAPVVVVDPDVLDAADLREYYQILEGPIKSHVKKAATQLEKTALRYAPPASRILVILNLGYTALSPDEFKSVCLKCAQNDTRQIDRIICGGIYYHSDKWDSYLFARFEEVVINVGPSFAKSELLAEKWSTFVESIATS